MAASAAAAKEITEVSFAKGKYFKISPQKARLVVNLVRGRNVTQALGILKITPKRGCRHVEKVLKSAIANAKEKQPTIDVDRLYVRRAYVDSGPTKMWIKVRNPKAPAATRILHGTF